MDPAEMKQELGLSDAQVTQIRKLHLDQRKAAIKRRADAQLARIELQELMQAPTVDEKAVALRVKEISDIQAANIKARVDTMLAMKKILTPEQQEKMKQLHRGRMQGPGMGPDGEGRGMMRRRMGPPPRDDEGNEPNREPQDSQQR
jgi:Spy/CpxP family protein refolding chaperone